MKESAPTLSPAQVASFQRREWAVQRAGWVVLWVFLLGGAAGLFGRGPVAHAHVVDASGARMDYDRFARNRTPTDLTMTIPADGHGDTATVWLDRRYADQVDIQRVTPEPVEAAVEPGRIVYRFLVSRGQGSVRVTFDLQPQALGRLRGRVGLLNSRGIAFSQLVYP